MWQSLATIMPRGKGNRSATLCIQINKDPVANNRWRGQAAPGSFLDSNPGNRTLHKYWELMWRVQLCPLCPQVKWQHPCLCQLLLEEPSSFSCSWYSWALGVGTGCRSSTVPARVRMQ